jgi:beta-phosphoglucomutase-like phosphatase (HAD superfamily)
MATGFRGVVFDVDGVLVDSPHERAWRDGLQQLMENEWSDIRDQTSYSPEAFTPQVYQTEMSGMPRYKGAQAALEYFGVPDAEERAQEYGDRKQEMITELIEASEFYAYPDALRFVLECKNAGLKMRARLMERLRVATTSGYGPRFLHSTGQLHKGDSGNRLFVQSPPITSATPTSPTRLGLPSPH